jgi:hypothetical protein
MCPALFFLSEPHARRVVVGFNSDMISNNIVPVKKGSSDPQINDFSTSMSRVYNSNFNYVGAFSEWCVKHSLPPKLEIKTVEVPTPGAYNSEPFVAMVVFCGRSFSASGSRKQSAKNKLYFQLYRDRESFIKRSTEPAREIRPIQSPPEKAPLFKSEEHANLRRLSDFSQSFALNFQIFLTMPEEERPYSVFNSLLGPDGGQRFFAACFMQDIAYLDPSYETDDPCAQARLALALKIGGFNPYGNGQTSEQFTITQPTITLSGGVYTCFSTCLIPEPTNLIGQDSTAEDAFIAWFNEVSTAISVWEPASTESPFCRLIKTIPPPPPDHELSFLWKQFTLGQLSKYLAVTPKEARKICSNIKDLGSYYKDDSEEIPKLKTKDPKRFEGSHNPYGNGQPRFVSTIRALIPSPKRFEGSFNTYGNQQMNREQYLSMNKAAFEKLSKIQREAKWKAYEKRSTGLNRRQLAPKSSNQLPVKQRAKVPKTAGLRRARLELSMCARIWYAALNCPFFSLDGVCPSGLRIPKEAQVCIPQFPGLKSRKVNYFARGAVGINDDGFGFVVLAPRRLSNNNLDGENYYKPIIASTTSNSLSNTFPTLDTGGALLNVSRNDFNTEFTTAMLISGGIGIGVEYRLAAAGLRIKSGAAPVTSGGFVHGIIEPDHDSLSNITLQVAGSYESYFMKPAFDCYKNWTQLCYQPISPEELLGYHRDTPSNSLTPTSADTHFMGFMFTGCPPGDSFEYNAIIHVEIIGRQVRGKTLTPIDPLGTAVVLNTTDPSTQLKHQPDNPVNATNDILKGASVLTKSPEIAMEGVKEIIGLGGKVEKLLKEFEE